MTSSLLTINETDRLLASVGVGQWTWDGHNGTLTMDPTCKGFFEIGAEEKASETAVIGRIHQDDADIYRVLEATLFIGHGLKYRLAIAD